MELICLGLNHETAPVEVREHFAVPVEQLGVRAKEIITDNNFEEGVVLSTCNRMEIYVATKNREVGLQELRKYLSQDRSAEEMAHLYEKTGEDVNRHLFRLVCGLDSMVLGETEIFGQVKQAYKQALESGATKGVLNRLFQKSFSVGKRFVQTQRSRWGRPR